MSNSSSTYGQPDFVRALRRKTAQNRQGKTLYTELLKSWSTLGQFLVCTESAEPKSATSLEAMVAVLNFQKLNLPLHL